MTEVLTPICDTSGEIVNHEETYRWVASVLARDGCVVIGWSEGTTHYDILFSVPFSRTVQGRLEPEDQPVLIPLNGLQGGITVGSYLFVSILRVGAFAFDLSSRNQYHTYFAEKLRLIRNSPESIEVARLINGVREHFMRPGEGTG